MILEHVRIANQIMMQWCKVEHELECPSDLYYYAVQGVTVSTFTLWLESPVVLCLVWVANWLIMSISNIEFAMFPCVTHKEVGTQFLLFLNSKCKMVWFDSFPVKAVIWCLCEHLNKEKRDVTIWVLLFLWYCGAFRVSYGRSWWWMGLWVVGQWFTTWSISCL